MPEFITGIEQNMIREVKNAVEGGVKLTDAELNTLIESSDAKVIGDGAECVVIENTRLEEESKVMAINYGDQDNPLDVFYLQRIYSTLFPEHFPRFYAAGIAGFTIREKVEGVSTEGRGYLVTDGKDWEGVTKTFADVYEFIKDVSPPVIFDDTAQNFILTGDGRIVFVDTLKSKVNLYSDSFWDTEKLTAYMIKKDYSEADASRVFKCLQRLQDLGYARVK
jgi:hypothetical protein